MDFKSKNQVPFDESYTKDQPLQRIVGVKYQITSFHLLFFNLLFVVKIRELLCITLNASAKKKNLQLVDVSLVIELQIFFLSFLGLFCPPLVT